MRLIDADALTERIKYCIDQGMGASRAYMFMHMIYDAPTIDAVEVVHGAWIERYGGISKELFYQCSKCYGEVDTDEFDYCPYCGARMKGADDE